MMVGEIGSTDVDIFPDGTSGRTLGCNARCHRSCHEPKADQADQTFCCLDSPIQIRVVRIGNRLAHGRTMHFSAQRRRLQRSTQQQVLLDPQHLPHPDPNVSERLSTNNHCIDKGTLRSAFPYASRQHSSSAPE